MTTVAPKVALNGSGDRETEFQDASRPDSGLQPRRRSWFARDPAWPVVALLAAWPLWWVLGIGDYIAVLLAIPMIHRMYRWRATRQRAIRVPPGFGLWALFLIVNLASADMLSQTAPNTLASPTSNRVISWTLRTLGYLAITVVMLYAGNLTERELPRRRLAWLLGLVGIYTVAGGIGGVVAPHLQFTSPVSLIVPTSLQINNPTLEMMLHPGLSQVMNLLGYAEGRPRAPFDYTNMWGNCMAILLPWLLVAAAAYNTRKYRRIATIVLVIAFVPVLYSLDRGLWVGLGVGVCYLAVRSALQGRMAMLGMVVGALAIALIVVLFTPVQSIITQRLANGKSDDSRTSLSYQAFNDALASPLIGYGDTRHVLGSPQSIAVGRSANCKDCGGRDVGGNGQLWLLLISTGFTGTALYLGFFAYGMWRYRRDRTPYGIAGELVLLLGFVFMIVYESVEQPLLFTMLACVILWKNDRVLRGEERDEEAVPAAEAGEYPARATSGRRAITGGLPA